jgi:hypothetical protein
MIGTLCVIAYVMVLGGAGAGIIELLFSGNWRKNPVTNAGDFAKSNLGWGWSFLVGSAALGAFLYVPLAVTGQISHSTFLTGFAACCVLSSWSLWRNWSSARFWHIVQNNWLADLPRLARWLVLALFLGAAWSTVLTPPTGFDARAIFGMKARLLYDQGSLATEDFQDVNRMNFNAHYPLLLPLVEAQWFWLQGSTSDTQLRFICIGYIAALASIVARQLKRYTSPRVAALATMLLLCVPIVIQANEGAGLTNSADLPLACYITAGALAIMNWLRKRTPQQAILAGLMFGAAALTKSEGTLWIGAATTCLLVALADRQSQWNRTVLRSGFAGAVVLAIILGLQMAVRERIPFSPYLRSYSAALSWEWLRQLSSRPLAVATFGLSDCLRPTVWNLSWPCIVAIMFLRRKQPVTTEIWFARLLIGMVAIVFFAIFIITPYHVYWQIATALHRLVMQLLPLAWVLAVEQLSATGMIQELGRLWNAVCGEAELASAGSVSPQSFGEPASKPLSPLRRAG